MPLIKCPICQIEFDTIAGLQAHLKMVHDAK
jgi:hypothetical protein